MSSAVSASESALTLKFSTIASKDTGLPFNPCYLKTLCGQSQGLSLTVKKQEVYQDPGEACVQGAIQSDAALRQSTEGRQMAAATLSVGVLLAILEAAPEIRVPFRVDSHHSSKLGGKSQGGRRDRNQPYRESPQRECITLDRTLVNRALLTPR